MLVAAVAVRDEPCGADRQEDERDARERRIPGCTRCRSTQSLPSGLQRRRHWREDPGERNFTRSGRGCTRRHSSSGAGRAGTTASGGSLVIRTAESGRKRQGAARAERACRFARRSPSGRTRPSRSVGPRRPSRQYGACPSPGRVWCGLVRWRTSAVGEAGERRAVRPVAPEAHHPEAAHRAGIEQAHQRGANREVVLQRGGRVGLDGLEQVLDAEPDEELGLGRGARGG